MMEDMTVVEMVGQLFVAACRRDAADDPVLIASQGFDALITSYLWPWPGRWRRAPQASDKESFIVYLLIRAYR
jgi:hypothetical protein